MSVAYKEWSLVCDALGRGEQSILIRKGGIHEECDTFSFWHREFFLFPTLFHQQREKLKLPPETEMPKPDGLVHIELFASIEWTQFVGDFETVKKLAPFHIWRDEEIHKRFHTGDGEGVHVAFVRVFRLETPWVIWDSPKYRGCRSWVELPDAEGRPAQAVIGKELHRQREAELLAILG